VRLAAEVEVHGRVIPIRPSMVRRAVRAVVAGERKRVVVSVTFVGREGMRRLNRIHKGHDRPTDVISFTLQDPRRGRIGDIYICRWQAAREAERRGIPLREELVRLVVHGTLHVLGHDHPARADRERSAMWRRQERYVRKLA